MWPVQLLHTAHVPAGEGPFPAVIALHGWGASAHDLIGLAPILHGGDAVVLCPQGPIDVPIAEGVTGHGWFPLTASLLADPARGSAQGLDPEAFAASSRAVGAFLDAALERYPIARHRVVLLGFSQGGAVAYDLFLRFPERFSGLAALSTWLAPEIADGAPPAEAHVGLPVLVMHGDSDPMVPVDRARSSRDNLLRYRVDLSYREFSMGHEIAPDALRALVGWLDDKVLRRIQLV